MTEGRHSVLMAQFPETIRRKIAMESRPPDSEVIDDIPDKRVVHRILESRLGQDSTEEIRAAIRAAVANHPVISWESINRHGCTTAPMKSSGIGRHPTPKKHPESASSNRGKENRVNG